MGATYVKPVVCLIPANAVDTNTRSKPMCANRPRTYHQPRHPVLTIVVSCVYAWALVSRWGTRDFYRYVHPSIPPSKQPDPDKEEEEQRNEAQPDAPANPTALRHPCHPAHGPREEGARLVEAVVHRAEQAARIRHLVANGHRNVLEHLHFGRQALQLRVILRLELRHRRVAVLPATVWRRGAEAGRGGP